MNKKEMETVKIWERIIATMFFPFYVGAYALSYALKLKNREDMPTVREWKDFIMYGKEF